jgi:anti-anti-sigma factor
MVERAGSLRVKLVQAEGTAVVAIKGEVDLRTSPELRTQLQEMAARVDGPLLIDLSGVEYMDSSGVGTIVFIKRELERAGRKLVLIRLQPRVRSVFEIAHLDKFFTIAESVAEALGK